MPLRIGHRAVCLAFRGKGLVMGANRLWRTHPFSRFSSTWMAKGFLRPLASLSLWYSQRTPHGGGYGFAEEKTGGGKGRRSLPPLHRDLLWISLCGLGYVMLWKQREQVSEHEKDTNGGVSRLLPLAPLAVKCIGAEDGRRSKHFNFLAEAVEMAAPSVVYIEKQQVVSTVFGRAVAASSGSGFIVDGDGYVLTNAHVVGTGEVQVKLQDGRVIKGQVTDVDVVADLALVKLELRRGERLPALQFGSSGDLRPGEWVVALGSPLSLSNTITAGIVSSVHRLSEELGIRNKPEMEYVQTDAPITIGNSGGPLVNLDGEVIGVNTMTAGPGISFAIPSDFAKQFVHQAKRETNTRSRYGIGISMLTITPRIRRSIRLRTPLPSDVTHGVLLVSVWPNGAASRAGLLDGDVIMSINGRPVRTSREVHELVQRGQPLKMEVVRGNSHIQLTVHPEPL